MSVKIRVSYQDTEELKQILLLLRPVVKSCKVTKGRQEGAYKKAYVEVKGLSKSLL